MDISCYVAAIGSTIAYLAKTKDEGRRRIRQMAGRAVASPYELSAELSSVVGSGPLGKNVAKDVEAATAAPAPVIVLLVGIESLLVSTFRVGYTITTDALDSLYKKVISYLKLFRVWYTITTDALDSLYKKAIALALVKHPVVNSSCTYGSSFTYNSIINIDVAVAIDS
ncbi:hypothetical protein IFM89_000945 [Coptis chinensis]|uniref:Uncharacterized protein n=1 Tax=Coptis chinensis TaxID=261450 RepID=A0A835M411_9MAGN|nr:hypothetical protein IFM89_000945 [Coptis chinensis]